MTLLSVVCFGGALPRPCFHLSALQAALDMGTDTPMSAETIIGTIDGIKEAKEKEVRCWYYPDDTPIHTHQTAIYTSNAHPVVPGTDHTE